MFPLRSGVGSERRTQVRKVRRLSPDWPVMPMCWVLIGHLAEGDGLDPLCRVDVEDIYAVVAVDTKMGRVGAWRWTGETGETGGC